jgi:hypothetical protein
MGGIRLQAVYRPQFIGESEKHKIVSLFSEAGDKKKINDDSDAETSESNVE